MITFKELGNKGGLGNQLFQIASTVGIAIENETYAAFPKWDYQRYFKFPMQTSESRTLLRVSEPTFHFDGKMFHLDNKVNIDLNGYFQTERYFQYCKDDIKTMFTFKEDFVQQVLSYYNENEVFKKEVIAISIRRGDYVNNKNYFQLPITYYFNALTTHFPNFNDYNIIIFSDDIPNCRVHFGGMENVYFSENNSDIEDLCLMTQCDHFIISNSTFSWWGAWLGESMGSKVIRPDGLFDGDLLQQNDSKDFYPERWLVQQKMQIDFTDVTFCIPVFNDHPDRINNLNLSVKHILKHFKTNIIIMEEEGDNVMNLSYISKSIKYLTCNNKAFHRTKMLNDMFKQLETPISANWDADVLISPISMYFAVEAIRQETAVMAFPYKWAFARVPRKIWFDKISHTLDIGVVGDTLFNGMYVSDCESVGGAMFMDNEKYLECGGENENFISFGAEDRERVVRLKILRKSITRVNGTLYHMQHFIGVNSSTRNAYFEKNKQEYIKICEMDEGSLLNYIEKWE